MAIETDTEFSLILVPASSRGSEGIITAHHPDEPYVIIKSVQTRYPSLLPKVDGFSVGDPGKVRKD